MNMTTTINIEELYNFLDLIQECINEIQKGNEISFNSGDACGLASSLMYLELINGKQYDYICECINNKNDIDPDALGSFDNFKDGE